jgi:IS30 family transposase
VPAPLRKTLTYDRGKEMAEHECLAQRLAIQVFFADPHSPWQHGTNENTNGLLRQYLPKGTDLSGCEIQQRLSLLDPYAGGRGCNSLLASENPFGS